MQAQRMVTLMSSPRYFFLQLIYRQICIEKHLLGLAPLFALLLLSLSNNAYAANLDSAKIDEQANSQARINFPSAPSNTPYKLVAELSFQAPPATFVYAQEHADQFAAYWPADHPDKEVKGVVAFVHGGCWLSAFDISHSYAFATGLAQAGFHVWSIEYRRTGNGGEWPVALQDVALGLQHISKLGELGVDLSEINILGHSAGGHLAAMLAAQLDDLLSAETKQVNFIGLAAIMDIVEYANGTNNCQTATPKFMRGTPEQQPIAYYLADPQNFNLLSKRLDKLELLQGDADAIVPVSQASHQNAATIKLQGAGHFDWIHPGSDAFKLLLRKLSSN